MIIEPEVDFYVRHFRQIAEWSKLAERVRDLMRAAVLGQDVDAALALLSGESGDAAVDFYIRNRHLISQWTALQPVASLALHTALIEGGRGIGTPTDRSRRSYSTVRVGSPALDALHDEHAVWVELLWTKGDLLTLGRGVAFPRLAMVHSPKVWDEAGRAHLDDQTRAVARSLGMTLRGEWWGHCRVLDGVRDGEGLHEYAERCLQSATVAAERFGPVLREAVEALA